MPTIQRPSRLVPGAPRRSQPNRAAPCCRQAASDRLDQGRPLSGSAGGSFRRRSAIGSMLSATASSSMALSSAKLPGASPGARIQDGVGTFSRATRCVVMRSGAAYIIRVITPDCSTNSSWPEVCARLSWPMASSRPSRSAPRRRRCRVRARWPWPVNTCCRVSATLQGRPVTLAPMAASTLCGWTPNLPPKPPPMKRLTTRTCCGSSLKVEASPAAHMDGPWLQSWTVSRPSAHSATAACGSMALWCSYGVS